MKEELRHAETPQLTLIKQNIHKHLKEMRLEISEIILATENPEAFLTDSLPVIQKYTSKYHSLYMEYQKEATKLNHDRIQCKGGCGNCCNHYPLSIEPYELIHFYAAVRQRPDFERVLEKCHERVEVYHRMMHEEFSKGRDPESEANTSELEEREDHVLQQFFMKQYRCPLLGGDENCSQYEERPTTCRMYLSLSAPEYCTPDHLLTPVNKNFIVLLPAEIEEELAEISDLFRFLDLPESMYEGILALQEIDFNPKR